MNIAICDNDKKYVKILNEIIISYFSKKNITVDIFFYYCGEDVLSSSTTFDIVFIDIEVGGDDGIQIIKLIKEKNKDILLFLVTGCQNYLDDAMDLNVFSYISKPVDNFRIINGLNTAIKILNSKEIKVFDIHSNLITIPVRDIIYIESKMRKTYIYLENKEFITQKSLGYFKEKLNIYCFVAPHNSYIVNFDFVKSFSRTFFTMTNNHEVPISQKRQHDIKKKFFEYIEGTSNI